MATKQAKKPHKAPEPTPDEQVHAGFFASVVEGEHNGRYGVVQSMGPKVSVLRTRDERDEMLLVDNHDLRPDVAGRR